MNTQIQQGSAEPYGYRSLANAVGAKLLVEVPSWTGVVWRPGSVQLAHKSHGRCLDNCRSCKVGHIFGRLSEKKRRLTMNTQIQKGLAEPYGYRSLAIAARGRLLAEVPS